MSIVTTPLGDGSFTDEGYISPNNFGVPIPFWTDIWTGADPFRAAIPNPPMTEDRYELTQVGFHGCLVDCVPPPVVCIIGCDVPQKPVETDVIPEPASALLMSAALVLALLRRRLSLG